MGDGLIRLLQQGPRWMLLLHRCGLSGRYESAPVTTTTHHRLNEGLPLSIQDLSHVDPAKAVLLGSVGLDVA